MSQVLEKLPAVKIQYGFIDNSPKKVRQKVSKNTKARSQLIKIDDDEDLSAFEMPKKKVKIEAEQKLQKQTNKTSPPIKLQAQIKSFLPNDIRISKIHKIFKKNNELRVEVSVSSSEVTFRQIQMFSYDQVSRLAPMMLARYLIRLCQQQVSDEQ